MIRIDSACQTLFSAVGLFDWVENLDGEIYRVGPGRVTLRFYLRFVKQYCRQWLREVLSTKRQLWFDVQRRAECLYTAHSKPSDKSEGIEHKVV